MSDEAFLIGNGQISRITGQRGTTPSCLDARFKRGDVVKLRKKKTLRNFPQELVVLVAIPPGFSPSYALADLVDEPRPLMAQVGAKVVTYILCEEGNPTPYLLKERDLLYSDKGPVEIGTIKRDGS